MTKPTNQFNRLYRGSLYMRGQSDSYFRNEPSPHWYPTVLYGDDVITDLDEEEINEYMAGYDENQTYDIHNLWRT